MRPFLVFFLALFLWVPTAEGVRPVTPAKQEIDSGRKHRKIRPDPKRLPVWFPAFWRLPVLKRKAQLAQNPKKAARFEARRQRILDREQSFRSAWLLSWLWYPVALALLTASFVFLLAFLLPSGNTSIWLMAFLVSAAAAVLVQLYYSHLQLDLLILYEDGLWPDGPRSVPVP